MNWEFILRSWPAKNHLIIFNSWHHIDFNCALRWNFTQFNWCPSPYFGTFKALLFNFDVNNFILQKFNIKPWVQNRFLRFVWSESRFNESLDVLLNGLCRLVLDWLRFFWGCIHLWYSKLCLLYLSDWVNGMINILPVIFGWK